MDIVTMLVVGLVAGLLASYVLGGIGYGLLGDIVVGIIGAFIGGWLFNALNITLPFTGLASAIFVAFIGALLFLLILRALMVRGGRRYAWGRGWRGWRGWRRRPIV